MVKEAAEHGNRIERNKKHHKHVHRNEIFRHAHSFVSFVSRRFTSQQNLRLRKKNLDVAVVNIWKQNHVRESSKCVRQFNVKPVAILSQSHSPPTPASIIANNHKTPSEGKKTLIWKKYVVNYMKGESCIKPAGEEFALDEVGIQKENIKWSNLRDGLRHETEKLDKNDECIFLRPSAFWRYLFFFFSFLEENSSALLCKFWLRNQVFSHSHRCLCFFFERSQFE